MKRYLHLMTDNPLVDTIVDRCDRAATGNVFVMFATQSKFAKTTRVNFVSSYRALKGMGYRAEDFQRIFIHYFGGYAAEFVLDNQDYREYYWFFWGADGYRLLNSVQSIGLPKTVSLATARKPVIRLLLEYFRRWRQRGVDKTLAFRFVNTCCTWVEGDFELIRSFLNSDAKFLFFSYLSTDELRLRSTPNVSKSSKKGASFRVLLGNSLGTSNNHVELVDFYEKTMSLDDEAIMPISYGGNSMYKRRIKAYASSRIKNITYLETFLAYEEYQQILDGVDIAIFFHLRQQGAGNALALLWMGKIVIMRDESTLYQTLQKWGLSVIGASAIKSTDDLLEFSRRTADRLTNNRGILLERLGPEKIDQCYRALYE